MRYNAEHKNKTRARILRHAGRLFRRRGFGGVSIDAVMDAAQLTRGGFYGHFDSKDDLLAQVVDSDHDLTRKLRDRNDEASDELAEQCRKILSAYLDPANQRVVGPGCTFASLSGDVARAPVTIRRRFADAMRRLLGEVDRGRSADTPSDSAIRAVLMAVGAVSMARACEDEELTRQMLRAAADGVARELA